MQFERKGIIKTLDLGKDRSETRWATSERWWKQLPMQNLENPSNSWSGYCMKYYPNKTHCGGLNENEILHIWQQEKINV